MIDVAEAERIARDWLARRRTAPPMPLELRTAETEEHAFGWVFHYGTKVMPPNSGLAGVLLGAAPVIVDRRDGSVHPLPSGLAIERCIETYERTGALPRLPLRADELASEKS